DPERRDLMASLHAAGSSASPREQNLATLTLQAEPTQPEGGERVSTWRNYGDVPPLGTANASSWAFSAEGWYWGLFGSNDATGEQVRLAFETPFQAWPVRNAVHLPSDQVIFQLGEDQICAFDPDGNRVALLWHGRGPLPVIAMPTSSGESPNSLVDRQALAGDSSAASAYSASGAKSAPLGQTTVPHSASNRMRAK